MIFRRATVVDVDAIMDIIRQAQESLRRQGVDQWQNNYPNDGTILNDIENGSSYVLLWDSSVLGTAAIIFGVEETYNQIYDGAWLTDGAYACIHRIAVAEEHKGSGIASIILKNTEVMCRDRGIHSIKIDTHEDNKSMQSLLEKNDFKYCGIIYLEDGSKRLAYEKVF